MSVSAVLITRDAERTLDRTLASLDWVDEIVVLDSGSRDRTEEIARRHGAVFTARDWPGYGIQKQRAVDASTGEWILSLDADEVVSEELAETIRREVGGSPEHAAYKMRMETEFLGARLGSRGWWRDWKLRLFHRERGRFNEEQVHEGVTVTGTVGFLEGPLYHYPWKDLEHRLEKENAYSTLSAIRDHERGRRSGVVRPYFRAAGWFVKEYLFRCGVFHGRPGLLHAGLTGAYAFQRAAKLHELTVRGGSEGYGSARPEPGRPGSDRPGARRTGSEEPEPDDASHSQET